MEKEVTFTDVKHMVAYVLNTKDQDLIEEYAYQLTQLRKEANDGIRYEIPKVEYNNETYYGKTLEVKDGKLFIDGEEIKEKNIHHSGTCTISNNKVGGQKMSNITIVGDLTSYESIQADKLYCDNVYSKGDIITNRLDCDNITNYGDITSNDKLGCDDIKCDNLTVHGDINSGDIEVDGDMNTFNV